MRASLSCKINNNDRRYSSSQTQDFDTKSIRSINPSFLRQDSYLSIPPNKLNPYRRRLSLQPTTGNHLAPPTPDQVFSSEIADSIVCSFSPYMNRKRFLSENGKRRNSKSTEVKSANSTKSICSLVEDETKDKTTKRKPSFTSVAINKLNQM